MALSDLSMLIDTWWTFVLPLISLNSLLFNVFNVYVLNGLRRTSSTYQLLFVKSIINIVYLFICCWIFVEKCGHYCAEEPNAQTSYMLNFLIQLYIFYAYKFVASLLAHSDLLIEILVAVERLKLLVKERSRTAISSTQSNPWTSCRTSTNCQLIMVALATFTIYLPRLIFTRIVRIDSTSSSSSSFSVHLSNFTHMIDGDEISGVNGEIQYRIEITNERMYFLLDNIATLYLRAALMLLLIVLINAANYYQLNNRMRAVECLDMLGQQEQQEAGFVATNTIAASCNRVQLIDRVGGEANAAVAFRRMLFFQSLVYLAGNVSFLLSPVMYAFLKDGRASPYFPFNLLINNTSLLISLSLNTLVFVLFDPRFRAHALDLIMP